MLDFSAKKNEVIHLIFDVIKSKTKDIDISSDEVSPIICHLYCLNNFGTPYLKWEPETIRIELKDKKVSDLTIDKIMACKLLHNNRSFWDEYDVFNNVVCVFNDVHPNFSEIQDVTPAEILNTLIQVSFIVKNELSEEVKKFISVCCSEHGLVVLPDELSVSQPYFDSTHPELKKLSSDIEKFYPVMKENSFLETDETDPIKVGVYKLVATELYINEELNKIIKKLQKETSI